MAWEFSHIYDMQVAVSFKERMSPELLMDSIHMCASYILTNTMTLQQD